MISSIEEAFVSIEKIQKEIPVEAIEYLYEHEPNKKITDKIIFTLNNAYNEELIYDEDTGVNSSMPLWYAIVAENHLSESLIEPVISLFNIADDEDDWDFLNEQGQYLAGLLCEKFDNIATTKFLKTIKNCAEEDRKCPVLFLFDCVFYVEKEKHLPLIFDILDQEKFKWLDSFVSTLGKAQIKEALERIITLRNIAIANDPDSWKIAEYDEAITELNTGKTLFPNSSAPYFKQRKNWRLHYIKLWDYLNKTKTISNPVLVDKKVGRNEPCPCGSGKKYKKCCL